MRAFLVLVLRRLTELDKLVCPHCGAQFDRVGDMSAPGRPLAPSPFPRFETDDAELVDVQASPTVLRDPHGEYGGRAPTWLWRQEG